MPRYFGYLEVQNNEFKEEDGKAHFIEVMQYKILIDKNKWNQEATQKTGFAFRIDR